MRIIFYGLLFGTFIGFLTGIVETIASANSLFIAYLLLLTVVMFSITRSFLQNANPND